MIVEEKEEERKLENQTKQKLKIQLKKNLKLKPIAILDKDYYLIKKLVKDQHQQFFLDFLLEIQVINYIHLK